MNRDQALSVVKSREWNIQAFSAHPLYLLIAASDSGWVVKEAFGAGYSHFFYTFEKGRAHMYYDVDDWRAIASGYKATVQDIAELQRLVQEGDAIYRAHIESAQEPGLETLEKARRLMQQLKYSCGFAHAIEGITYGSELDLRQILIDKNVFDEITFSKLCTPEEPSFLSDAQKELWQIKIANIGEVRAKAQDFLAHYGWIENTYLGTSGMSVEDVIQKANDMTEEPLAAEFEIIRREKKDLMQTFQFNDEERFLVATINTAFKWQDDRKKHILESIGALDPALQKLAEEYGIDFTSLKYALPVEITAERLGSSEFRNELMQRLQGCAMYSSSTGDSVFTKDDYTHMVRELHIDIDPTVSEFKGVVASKGIVRGVVRVCYSVSDIARVQKGEILVASMTRPEYLPAMQKAAAYITDEGGITSHAAIVSRELKKPCIIGTRIATRILKNGDVVEVDANVGVVRIMSPFITPELKSVE